MKKFEIKVTTQSAKKINGLDSYWGRISIENLSEKFVMPVTCWSLEDYTTQWIEGAYKILHEQKSCFITVAQNLNKNPLVILWSLYKAGDTIFIRNHMFNKKIIKDRKIPFKLSKINKKNCYRLTKNAPRKTHANGYLIAEWTIHVDDIKAWLNAQQ